MYETTAGAEVVDAVASNLAILKSPTILRQENGNLWAWEGCFTEVGCCPGSCTHVWNYAQAIGHLFPRLERGLREQELKRSMDETGHVTFRSALPDGPTTHDFHPAADGQLGGILKLFREWQISGDTAWLREMYPLAKKSLNYCIQRWDPDRRGACLSRTTIRMTSSSGGRMDVRQHICCGVVGDGTDGGGDESFRRCKVV